MAIRMTAARTAIMTNVAKMINRIADWPPSAAGGGFGAST